jgi:hypothetical protein
MWKVQQEKLALAGIRIKWFYKTKLNNRYGSLCRTYQERETRRIRVSLMLGAQMQVYVNERKALKVITPLMQEAKLRYEPIAKFE